MAALSEISHFQPDVVITPECYLDGYIVTEDSISKEGLVEYAVNPEKSELVQETSTWAEANNSWLILGCMRKTDTGVYNSALIFNRQGNLVDIYDKTHCQRHDKKFLPWRWQWVLS